MGQILGVHNAIRDGHVRRPFEFYCDDILSFLPTLRRRLLAFDTIERDTRLRAETTTYARSSPLYHRHSWNGVLID